MFIIQYIDCTVFLEANIAPMSQKQQGISVNWKDLSF